MKKNEFLKSIRILNLKSSAVTIGIFQEDLLKLIEENQIQIVNGNTILDIDI
jgi:hypothetical protein